MIKKYQAPRLLSFLLIAVVLLLVIALTTYDQFYLVVYKISLIALAAVTGYWLDRALFPYARPDSFLVDDWRRNKVEEFGSPGAADYPVIGGYQKVYAAAMIRRALIIVAVVIGVAVAL